MTTSIVFFVYCIGFIITICWWIFYAKRIEQSIITNKRILQCIFGFFIGWSIVSAVAVLELIYRVFGRCVSEFLNKPRFEGE